MKRRQSAVLLLTLVLGVILSAIIQRVSRPCPEEQGAATGQKETL